MQPGSNKKCPEIPSDRGVGKNKCIAAYTCTGKNAKGGDQVTKPGLKEDLFDAPALVRAGPREHLFYRNPEGNLSWREKRATGWSETRPLPRQGSFFCATVGKNLLPHLVILEKGALFHLPFPPVDSAITQPFYRDPEKDYLHPLLTADNQGNLHLICFARDHGAGRWWFLHHRYAQDRWEEPRVIDFGSGLQPLYGTASVDRRDLLHFAYLLSEGAQTRLYYRCYDPGNVWSKAVPVTAPGQISRPVLLPGPDFNLHLLWISGRPEGYCIFFRKWLRKGWGGLWTEEIILSVPYPEPPSPYLSLGSDGLAAGWLAGNRTYRCAETAGGWGTPEILQTESDQPLLALRPAFSGAMGNIAGWISAAGDPPCPIEHQFGLLPSSTPLESAPVKDEIETYFRDLDQYSRGLVSQASSLSTAKSRLEQTLEGKRKELVWLSRQSEQRIQDLNQNLHEKDQELKELQDRLQETIRNLRSRTEQTRKAREEEQKRERGQLKKLQQDSLHLKKMLLEKEHTISGLETRLQKQALQIAALEQKNCALVEKLARKQPFHRKILALLHQISQGSKTS